MEAQDIAALLNIVGFAGWIILAVGITFFYKLVKKSKIPLWLKWICNFFLVLVFLGLAGILSLISQAI